MGVPVVKSAMDDGLPSDIAEIDRAGNEDFLMGALTGTALADLGWTKEDEDAVNTPSKWAIWSNSPLHGDQIFIRFEATATSSDPVYSRAINNPTIRGYPVVEFYGSLADAQNLTNVQSRSMMRWAARTSQGALFEDLSYAFVGDERGFYFLAGGNSAASLLYPGFAECSFIVQYFGELSGDLIGKAFNGGAQIVNTGSYAGTALSVNSSAPVTGLFPSSGDPTVVSRPFIEAHGTCSLLGQTLANGSGLIYLTAPKVTEGLFSAYLPGLMVPVYAGTTPGELYQTSGASFVTPFGTTSGMQFATRNHISNDDSAPFGTAYIDMTNDWDVWR